MPEKSAKPAIVFVLPVLHPAGAERVVADLARRLPALGFQTSVICLEDERAPVGDELTTAGVEVHGLRLSRRRTLACAAGILKHLPQQRPLIINAHLFHANIAARMAFSRMPKQQRENVQVLTTIHVAERRFRPWQFMLDRATSRYARAEICVSRAVARFQQQHTGIPDSFFRVIENGIDLSRFTPGTQKNEDLRVVSVGRLDAQKDFPTLLHAWQKVSSAHPGAELIIAGEGPERTNLESLSKSLKLRNVSMPGFVKDIPALLRSAALYIQPSAWEGFGLAVAEAMACELPVIVSDVDSLPELVTHGNTGIVFPRGNSEALAEAMLDLLENRDGARTLACAARTEATRRFSIERMVADYARLYDETVQRHSRTTL